jgi:hypothetical protein
MSCGGQTLLVSHSSADPLFYQHQFSFKTPDLKTFPLVGSPSHSLKAHIQSGSALAEALSTCPRHWEHLSPLPAQAWLLLYFGLNCADCVLAMAEGPEESGHLWDTLRKQRVSSLFNHEPFSSPFPDLLVTHFLQITVLWG